MNLTFGVCWIEDQASSRLKLAVERAIRTNGFEPEIELVVAEHDIQAFARRQQHFQDYDLILLDLRLGGNQLGDDLAPRVRRHFRSTPIVFYSAVSVPELRRRMAERGVDGVYCASRNALAKRVEQLISDLTPTLNRLSGMRGLAAQVVAECDEDFRHILLHIKDLEGNEPEIVQSLKGRLAKSHAHQTEETGGISSLSDLFDNPAISSGLLFNEVYKRLRNLASASDDVREARLAVRDYGLLVLKRRNILSHALENRTPEGWTIDGGAGKPDLTAADFPDFRSDFLAFRANIRRLRELLIRQ